MLPIVWHNLRYFGNFFARLSPNYLSIALRRKRLFAQVTAAQSEQKLQRITGKRWKIADLAGVLLCVSGTKRCEHLIANGARPVGKIIHALR